MVQIFIQCSSGSGSSMIDIDAAARLHVLKSEVAELMDVPMDSFHMYKQGGVPIPSPVPVVELDNVCQQLESCSINDSVNSSCRCKCSDRGSNSSGSDTVGHHFPENCLTLTTAMSVLGGIDFQHREGSKVGSGGQLSEANAAIERKERLRKLALETIDISKDPYFMRNHLGTYECKLCLTIHNNEGNYLAHTQGKRHQYNLGQRAAMEAKNAAPKTIIPKEVTKKRVIRIGRPGYKITKSRDPRTNQRCITFELDYPEGEDGVQPRHRFMSAYEQKVEPADRNYQYLLFACDPYEIIAFKIPNEPIDKQEGRFFTRWDISLKKFVLQLHFADNERQDQNQEQEQPV